MASEVNKSDKIREYLSAHPKAQPKEVIEALAKKDVAVTASLVSAVKANAAKKAEGGTATATGAKRGRKAGSKASTKAGVTPESLVAYRRLIEKHGGLATVKNALAIAAEVSGLDNFEAHQAVLDAASGPLPVEAPAPVAESK